MLLRERATSKLRLADSNRSVSPPLLQNVAQCCNAPLFAAAWVGDYTQCDSRVLLRILIESEFSSRTQAMVVSQTILMCPPIHFNVDYVINYWMQNQSDKVDRLLAARQWENLRSTLARHISIAFVPPEPNVPDMVFTANAGLVVGENVIVSRFVAHQRQAEEPFIRRWFKANRFNVADWPTHVTFEGAGDALLDRGQRLIWVGYGYRSHAAAPALVEQVFGYRTVALKLIDERFYHLDTCFCPLDGGWLMYYPKAFDERSREKISMYVEPDKLIAVDEADAEKFACNAVNIGRNVIMNHASDQLQSKLYAAMFKPVLTPLSEFMRAGGGAKCLTLKLVEF